MKIDKKQKIVNASKKLFEKYGYKKVSVDMIVQKSGIAKGTFYLYFKSKDELYKYIVDKTISDAIEIMDYLSLTITDASERLFEFLTGAILYYEENPILKYLRLHDKEYFSDNVNDDYIDSKYNLIIDKLLKGIDYKTYFKETLSIKQLGDVLLAHSYIIEMKESFKSRRDYFEFVITYAKVIVDGVSKSNNVAINPDIIKRLKKTFNY